MTSLLRIDASARIEGSHSRALGDHFEQQWRRRVPEGEVLRRDLAADPIGQIRQETITGFYAAPDQVTIDLKAATALSDRLIEELKRADALLLTTPAYNFSVPAALKAWIDQITRIGHTFGYDDGGFHGLLELERAYVIGAYGASGYRGGALASADFLAPYLDFLLRFLGIRDVRFVSVEATTADPETVRDAMTTARAEIDALLD